MIYQRTFTQKPQISEFRKEVQERIHLEQMEQNVQLHQFYKIKIQKQSDYKITIQELQEEIQQEQLQNKTKHQKILQQPKTNLKQQVQNLFQKRQQIQNLQIQEKIILKWGQELLQKHILNKIKIQKNQIQNTMNYQLEVCENLETDFLYLKVYNLQIQKAMELEMKVYNLQVKYCMKTIFWKNQMYHQMKLHQQEFNIQQMLYNIQELKFQIQVKIYLEMKVLLQLLIKQDKAKMQQNQKKLNFRARELEMQVYYIFQKEQKTLNLQGLLRQLIILYLKKLRKFYQKYQRKIKV
ncbi:hypothetical protein IMG5_160050 [Ichthyophthirius multifiliis]|uniref:Uncharacterized protein n=1 Tax=Ichthyophthirius multifiliis TaxID=5932 RepID=G0QZV3_ICHMU|nr:hypothetical protein IMG5_160050 [Ichthyophthirius multifiliis]EGR29248.1 hypothetical protein IMG5_160050 [Ichthyophthirius multifiliis]|eukprot:XP_004030484.1 hypothetical protein IMG5_160050 [Ichthyophthirius multifiliis]